MSSLNPIYHQGSMLIVFEDATYIQNVRQNLCRGDALKSSSNCYSVYKNITVFWDEDFDERILSFIDTLAFSFPYVMYCVLFVYEHEGGIEIGFSHPISPSLAKYLSDPIDVAGDIWSTSLINIYE